MLSKQESSYLKKIHSKVGKTINQFQLIEENDRVLVGLSGGKDSLALLGILNERIKFIPIDYKIFPVHVTTKQLNHLVDIQYLKSFCKERGLELLVEEIEIDLERGNSKKACFVCSWNRRKALFQLMKKLNCNKLAFGHHMDDAIETMLMNMTFNAEISAFPAKLLIKKGNFHVIRPLLHCSDDEMKRFAELKNYELSGEKCPYELDNKRAFFKEKVKELSELHKLAKVNLFNSMGNIINEYLPWNKKDIDSIK